MLKNASNCYLSSLFNNVAIEKGPSKKNRWAFANIGYTTLIIFVYFDYFCRKLHNLGINYESSVKDCKKRLLHKKSCFNLQRRWHYSDKKHVWFLCQQANLVFKSFKQNIKETRLLLHHTSTIYAIKTTTSNVIQTFFLSPMYYFCWQIIVSKCSINW